MSLLKKAMTLAVGEGAARVLGVFVYVIIARSLGVEGFGIFSFATSISLFALTAIDMGQNKHASRLVARSGGELTHVWARMTLNKLILGVLFAIVTAGVLLALGMTQETIWTTVLMIGWATVLNAVEGVRAILRAQEMMAADSVITSAESLGRFIAVVIVATVGGGVVGFGWAFLVEALVAAVVVFVVVSRRMRLLPSAAEWIESRSFLRASATLGFLSIATIGFYRIDQMFVLPLAGETASGLYGAAARIAFTATVAASLVNQAAFPRLAAAYKDAEEYHKQLLLTIQLSGLAGLGISATIFILAGPIINVLYGDAYTDAIVLLRILAVAVLLNSLANVGLNSANALHREKKILPIVLVLLAIVSVANLVLVPTYGVLASAWISVGGEVLLAVSILSVSRDMFSAHPHGERGPDE